MQKQHNQLQKGFLNKSHQLHLLVRFLWGGERSGSKIC